MALVVHIRRIQFGLDELLYDEGGSVMPQGPAGSIHVTDNNPLRDGPKRFEDAMHGHSALWRGSVRNDEQWVRLSEATCAI